MKQIIYQFKIKGNVISIEEIKTGKINDTYLVSINKSGVKSKVILQRINKSVFINPENLMENICLVTDTINSLIKNDTEWEFTKVIPCKNNKKYYTDKNREYWRCMTYIEGDSFSIIMNRKHAYESGAVLGKFHELISGIEINKLNVTIPDFHNTVLYLKKYDNLLLKKERIIENSEEAGYLRKFIEEHRKGSGLLQKLYKSGKLLLKPVHGDPKINNIILNKNTGKGISIIDIDTVMPGFILHDIGDILRSACSISGEEEQDMDKVEFNLDICSELLKGYMEYGRNNLSETDIEYIFESIKIISFELCLRFFTDYLEGNKYFKVEHEKQNLNRAVVQSKLYKDIEKKEIDINNIKKWVVNCELKIE